MEVGHYKDANDRIKMIEQFASNRVRVLHENPEEKKIIFVGDRTSPKYIPEKTVSELNGSN